MTTLPLITQTLPLLLPLLERFEGLRLRPYLCPASVPTIGLGSTHYSDGRAVTLADSPITADQARQMARDQLARDYLPGVLELCPGIDTPQRLAAIGDFAYNLGLGALKGSTLRKRINAGRWGDVPGELAKWVQGGGRVLPGLVSRRQAEAALI